MYKVKPSVIVQCSSTDVKNYSDLDKGATVGQKTKIRRVLVSKLDYKSENTDNALGGG